MKLLFVEPVRTIISLVFMCIYFWMLNIAWSESSNNTKRKRSFPFFPCTLSVSKNSLDNYEVSAEFSFLWVSFSDTKLRDVRSKVSQLDIKWCVTYESYEASLFIAKSITLRIILRTLLRDHKPAVFFTVSLVSSKFYKFPLSWKVIWMQICPKCQNSCLAIK